MLDADELVVDRNGSRDGEVSVLSRLDLDRANLAGHIACGAAPACVTGGGPWADSESKLDHGILDLAVGGVG
jgi:hypothetical protein